MRELISKAVFAELGQNKDSIDKVLDRMLSAIRKHLGMELAFISEFRGERRFLRHINSDDAEPRLRVNHSDPLADSYCQRVIDGRLPSLIHDASKLQAAQELSVTSTFPIGAHLSVPIFLRSGDIYGTLCAFSTFPDLTLQERDISLMRVFAEIIAEQIEDELEFKKIRTISEGRINKVLSDGSMSMVYQPIFRLEDHKIVGFESLARFDCDPIRPPDEWFDEASRVDLNIPLELKAIQLALQALDYFPADTYITVNISPDAINNGDLERIFDGQPLERIVLEITEHSLIHNYEEINQSLSALRSRGLKIAVDDAGAGFASFKHVLNIAPDLIKIDQSITRNIDRDLSRRAMARSLIGFASETGAAIVAEGVETEAELSTLRNLEVEKVQGFLLGKPVNIDDVLKLYL